MYTREDFAGDFACSFKEALRLAQQDVRPHSDFSEWLEALKAEAELIKAEGAQNDA